LSAIPPDVGAKMVDLFNMIKNLEKADIEDIYQKAGEQYELTKEDIDRLLNVLETEGKILRSEQYIKTKA
jgi:CBS-domain-containing membrane protein